MASAPAGELTQAPLRSTLESGADSACQERTDASSVDSEHAGLLTVPHGSGTPFMQHLEPLLPAWCSTRLLVRFYAASMGLLLLLLVALATKSWSAAQQGLHPSRMRARGPSVDARHTAADRPAQHYARQPMPEEPVQPVQQLLQQQGARIAPPPLAPLPPLPPFPISPPMKLAAEPSLRSACAHLAVPVDAERLPPRYPGGAWQLFAEWSGLDEAAMEEAHGSYGSYQYGDERPYDERPGCASFYFIPSAVPAAPSYSLACGPSSQVRIVRGLPHRARQDAYTARGGREGVGRQGRRSSEERGELLHAPPSNHTPRPRITRTSLTRTPPPPGAHVCLRLPLRCA